MLSRWGEIVGKQGDTESFGFWCKIERSLRHIGEIDAGVVMDAIEVFGGRKRTVDLGHSAGETRGCQVLLLERWWKGVWEQSESNEKSSYLFSTRALGK